jgi:hypothetical protein
MTARRVFGLLTALLMLHLTIVGADLRCADHSVSAAGEHQTMGVTHGPTRSATTAVATTNDRPCQTPTQPACCRALTSCAVNVVLRADQAAAPGPLVRHAIQPATTRLPASPITAPEPPPPKA